MANKRALGRGLRALLPDIASENKSGENILFIPVSVIEPNPFQPRERFDADSLSELRRSIEEKGVIQPITVRRRNSGFQLIAGERRLRAVKDLGIESIPAYILEVESDAEMLEMAIIENIHREDLNPLDIANGYKRLIQECQLTQEEVAQKVGKDRTTITNFLRLLKLPRRIQESLQDGSLGMGHARSLLSLESSEYQLELWKKIIKDNLSVRKVEDLVRARNQQKPEKKTGQEQKSVYVLDFENRLRTRLATQVRIKSRKRGGSIEVDFYSDDDLDRLVSLICQE